MKLHTVNLVSLVLLFSFQTLAYSENGSDNNSNTPLIRDKCLVDFGNFQSAENKFSDILTKTPLDTDVLYCRGILRVESGQYKAAIADLTTLIETEPTAGAYLNRADAWRRLGEIEKSDIDLANASKISGTSSGYYVSANILQSIGRFHDAIIDSRDQ